MDDQFAVSDFVSQGSPAAHPLPALARGGNLIADTLTDQLALELRERHKDVQRHPTHRVLGVEGLSHGDERDTMAFEQLDEIQEVEHRPRKPIDLVDDNHIDLAG